MDTANNREDEQPQDNTNNDRNPLTSMQNLADDHIVNIALFLAAENRALFIIGNYISDEALREIIGMTAHNEWEILDFGRIPPDEASKITDVKLSAIFDAVDAQNTVKTLRLTGCVNLSGHGLRKIRTSRIVEEIDLNHKVEGSLDIVEVMDTLHILLSRNFDDRNSRVIHRDNMLKVVLFPVSWLVQYLPLSQFLSHYYRDISNRNYACISCDRLCADEDSKLLAISSAEFRETLLSFGVNKNMCTWCRQSFCRNSNGADESVIDLCSLNVCAICSRTSCSTCDKVASCHYCFMEHCYECFAKLAACPVCRAER